MRLMLMGPRLRKLALTAHLTSSIGWLGAVIAFLAPAIAGVTSDDAQTVRSACVVMGLMVSYVIVPLAFASLLSGLVSALGTKWELFRHYWVSIKLVLTIVAVVVLLVQVGPVRDLADMAADSTASIVDIRGAARRPLIHAVGGLTVLLVVQALGVYKPRGMTPYGQRRSRASSSKPQRSATGTPTMLKR